VAVVAVARKDAGIMTQRRRETARVLGRRSPETIQTCPHVDPERDAEGIARLWGAVIVLALVDAHAGDYAALAWLRDEAPVDALGIDSDAWESVLRRLNALSRSALLQLRWRFGRGQ